MSTDIHPSSVVDPSARLGSDVKIGPFCVIEADVEIGAGTVIGPRVSILRYSRLGARCRVHANAVIGDLPMDFAFADVPSSVWVGDDVVIREHATIHRGTAAQTETRVGDGCFLMVNSHLAHNVSLENEVILGNNVGLGGYVSVGARAFVSANSLVHQYVRIGRLAMIGGASAITMDVPPFLMTHPGAYNEVVGLNVVGLRRAKIGSTERQALRRAYRTLYRSALAVPAAFQQIRAESSSPVVAELCDFAEESERGICR